MLRHKMFFQKGKNFVHIPLRRGGYRQSPIKSDGIWSSPGGDSKPELIKSDGIWSSPGGDSKQFKAKDIDLRWMVFRQPIYHA